MFCADVWSSSGRAALPTRRVVSAVLLGRSIRHARPVRSARRRDGSAEVAVGEPLRASSDEGCADDGLDEQWEERRAIDEDVVGEEPLPW
jgi:hypothetical protein